MSIALELTVEAHNRGTDVYYLQEVRHDGGPRTLQVEYKCDDNLIYPLDEAGPRTPARWEISGAAADAFEAKLASLSVRVIPEFAMGLDGTTTKLTIQHGFNQITLCWWANLPDAWQDLRGLLAQLYASRPGQMTGDEE